MITREQLSEMINKHFGKQGNKKAFLDELFKKDNILCPGTITDSNDEKATNIDDSTYFIIRLQLYNESCAVVIAYDYEEKSYASFWYNNKKDKENNLIFHCRSIDFGKNKFELDGNYGGVNGDLSIEKINELINLEKSVKQISKYFK